MNIFTIGQLVESGSLLGEVVPDEEDLIIEARVLPEDSAFVQKDMKAFIAVTSYDQSIYGRMQGKVEKISANTRTDQNTGEIFYTATLSANSATTPISCVIRIIAVSFSFLSFSINSNI